MKILIVSATAEEVAPFSALLQKKHKEMQSSPDVLITGVGMTATAYHLGRQLSCNRAYDLIVNVGIAGSFDHSIPLTSVVRITQDTFAELGAEDKDGFLPISDMGFGENTFHEKLIDDDPALLSLRACKGLTVNRVHGNDRSIRNILSRFPEAETESMEGAAVFYAAAESGIPVVQIRAISNNVEPRNRSNWKIGPAIHALNDWLANFIDGKIP